MGDPESARSDRMFCGATCRKAASRDGVRRAVADLRQVARDVEAARSLRGTRPADFRLTRSELAGGLEAMAGRLRHAQQHAPISVERFGLAVVAAALAPVLSTTCRWCLASKFAADYGWPLPGPDAGPVLGKKTCGRPHDHLRDEMNALAAGAGVAPRRAPAPAPRRRAAAHDPKEFTQLVGAPRPRWHKIDECVTCHDMVHAAWTLRSTLVASGSDEHRRLVAVREAGLSEHPQKWPGT
jgi:hypothetical protein